MQAAESITMDKSIDLLQMQFPQTLRLNIGQLARVINWHPQTIRNYVSEKKFAIRTYLDGRFRYADIRDVADYLDNLRNKSAAGRPTKASLIESQK